MPDHRTGRLLGISGFKTSLTLRRPRVARTLQPALAQGEKNMKRMKWALALSATILSTVLIMTISSPRLAVRADSKPASGTDVKIDNFSFGPDLTIGAGTTVTWTNHDEVPHTVSSDSKIFKSKGH